MQVGRLIRSLREEKGLRSADLALAIGVSRSYVSRIENEDRKLSSRLLLRIAEVLSVEPDLLMDVARQDPRDLRLRKTLELLLRDRLLNPRFIQALFDLFGQDPTDCAPLKALGKGVLSCTIDLHARLLSAGWQGGWNYEQRKEWVRAHLGEFIEHLPVFEDFFGEELFITCEEGPMAQGPPPKHKVQGVPLVEKGSDVEESQEMPRFDFLGSAALENLCAFTLRDNTMAPVLEAGATVLFSLDRVPKSGDRVVACLDNGKLTCKIFRKRGDWIQLVSHNPIYEPLFLREDEVRFLYPVVRHAGTVG